MEFLTELSKYYEIVVFTAGVQEYADWVIDQIDHEKRIKHRLYREHTIISPHRRRGPSLLKKPRGIAQTLRLVPGG